MRVVLSMLLPCIVLGSAVSESGCWGAKKQFASSSASAPVRKPPKSDLYGVVKSVDAIGRTVTLNVEKDGEKSAKTYEVMPDATVLLEEPGRLADLAAGQRVALVFGEDGHSVAEVRSEPYRISVKPKSKAIEVNERFEVELRVVNASALPQSFREMTCSRYENWASSNPDVPVAAWNCARNFPAQVKLAPGQTHTTGVLMRARTAGRASFRLGLTPLIRGGTPRRPIDSLSRRTYWSDEVRIDVATPPAH